MPSVFGGGAAGEIVATSAAHDSKAGFAPVERARSTNRRFIADTSRAKPARLRLRSSAIDGGVADRPDGWLGMAGLYSIPSLHCTTMHFVAVTNRARKRIRYDVRMSPELPSAERLRIAPCLRNLIGFLYRSSLAKPDGDAAAAWEWLGTQMQARFGIDPIGLRRFGALVTKTDGDLPYAEGERVVGQGSSEQTGSEPPTMNASLTLAMMAICNVGAAQEVDEFADRIELHEQGETDRGETRLFDSLLSDVVKLWPGLSFPAIESRLPSTIRETQID